MGKNNRARRAAKAKGRARQRSGGSASGSWGGARGEWSGGTGQAGGAPDPFTGSVFGAPRSRPRRSPYDAARELWDLAARDEASNADFRALDSLELRVVDEAAESILLQCCDGLWAHGWQPAELQRQGRLASPATASRLIDTAIAADHAARVRHQHIDARWQAQLDALGLPARVAPGWLARWRTLEGHDRLEARVAVRDALASLVRLPVLEVLIPPPGSSPATASRVDRDGSSPDPMLQRIRNLLAKAESTEFEAEATALTGKAQELMTRHAIDQALIAGGHEILAPVMVRIPIDAPYADAKSFLLQTVASASRCRTLFHPSLAMTTVVGDQVDVSAVEVLFTSLLVQAQRALTEAGRASGPGSRSRTPSFRSAFLLAFAHRIGDRLAESNQHVFDAASAHSGTFLPVLRSQEVALDEFMSATFGVPVHHAVRGGYDSAGHVQGRLAADAARLRSGDLDEAGRAAG